jgi:hypothetical protein
MSNMDGVVVLRTVWRITEWRDGCVYRTEKIGTEWVPRDSVQGRMGTVGDLSYGAPPRDYEGLTIRRAE